MPSTPSRVGPTGEGRAVAAEIDPSGPELTGYGQRSPALPEAHVPLHPCSSCLDGTMFARLARGWETVTRAEPTGLFFRSMPTGTRRSLFIYGRASSGAAYRRSVRGAAGRGNQTAQIKRRPTVSLPATTRPGDKIILMGYPAGGATRSARFAGADRPDGGLLRRGAEVEPETLDRVYAALPHPIPTVPRPARYRLARCQAGGADPLTSASCDTVRALGLLWPGGARGAGAASVFHSHGLGPATEMARHAPGLDGGAIPYCAVCCGRRSCREQR